MVLRKEISGEDRTRGPVQYAAREERKEGSIHVNHPPKSLFPFVLFRAPSSSEQYHGGEGENGKYL